LDRGFNDESTCTKSTPSMENMKGVHFLEVLAPWKPTEISKVSSLLIPQLRSIARSSVLDFLDQEILECLNWGPSWIKPPIILLKYWSRFYFNWGFNPSIEVKT